jgi:DNA gyrase subunit A
MARRTTKTVKADLSAFDQAGARVLNNPLTTEVEDSYLEYAYSVIHSRALPDARDGLKPVHRRILFSMSEQGHRPDRGHVKSSRVVGDVMGKYHPHGDTAIYDAMVRMAQDFSLNVPLIDGHGNFGSPDDGPAASRYTEARMSREAMLLVGELDEGTVDFRPNYDGSLQEPAVLPAAFPNLLVNGSSGIAVGMATNMIPHNLAEVVAAARWLINHPAATLDKLMEFVPGPDLPTGGLLLGLDEVRRAYETGRGVVRMRGRVEIGLLEGSRGRQAITVTELPYGIGAEKTAPGSSSSARSASTRRPCSPTSTGSPRWSSPSASTTWCSSTASRRRSGSRRCWTCSWRTATRWSPGAPSSGARSARTACTSSTACSSRCWTSTG